LFRTRGRGLLLVGLMLVVLAVGMALFFLERDAISPIAFLLIQVVQLLFLVDLAVAAAATITKEREARTWPILLMTPLENGEIIKGKAIGVLRRNLPLLLPVPVLYLFMLLLSPTGQHVMQWSVAGVVLPAIALVGTTFFLLGTGLYFSARLKTTTAAVVATFAVYVVPKFFFCGFLSPLFAMSSVMSLTAGRGTSSVPLTALVIAVAPAVIYVGLGMLFMRLAVSRVRRDIF
jgi:hypothetical protein